MNYEVMIDQEAEKVREKSRRERAERNAAILEALQAGYFAGICSACKEDLEVNWVECTRFKDKNAKFIPGPPKCKNPNCEARGGE